MSGMFWHNNYSPSIKINLMLHEKELTLKKLMDDDNILQECRAQNKKLLKFLTRLDILEELVNLIIEEPSQDIEERWRYKYSNIACELLTCEVSILTEKLAGNEMLMSKLYSFIDKDQPLNPLLASFFSKILHTLLRRTSYQNWFSYQFACLQVLESFKSHKNWVDLLLQHIQTSAVMDLILVLTTKIESPEISLNISNWLNDQQLIQRLIKLLSPLLDSEKHSNASQLLSDIIKSSRLEGENLSYPIYQTLQSEETIKLILDTILSGEKIESSIVGGVKILISLLGQTESSESYKVPFNNIVEDEKRDKFAILIIQFLDKLNLLLLNPPEKQSIKTTVGILEKPFGPSRLNIVKLYVSLLSTKNTKILKKFVEFNTFKILLDLFFQYSWNNFLHTQVQQCLSLMISCNCPETNEIIYFHIFVKNKLINRILEALDNNDQNNLNQINEVKQGYMGHLIILSNDIVARCEENNFLSTYLKQNLSEENVKKWENFIISKLDEINKKQDLILGDSSEGYESSEANCGECIPFQDLYDVESNTDYQEQTTPVYVDEDYNFQLEKFNDGNNTFQNSVDQFHNKQSFNTITPDEFKKKEDLFNKICDEKKFEDIDNDIQWTQDSDLLLNKTDLLSKTKQKNSSSSDEENEDNPGDLSWVDIESLDKSNTSIKLLYTEDPKPVEETGWANFNDFCSSFEDDINSVDDSWNKRKLELQQISPNYESISLLDSEFDSRLNFSENKEDINKKNNSELKTDEINVTSALSSEYIETSKNISDGNANITIIGNKTLDSKDVYNHLEESSTQISDDVSENIINFQITTNITDDVSSEINTVIETSK